MQKYSTHKSTSGFTLIELLILIAIIGERSTKVEAICFKLVHRRLRCTI